MSMSFSRALKISGVCVVSAMASLSLADDSGKKEYFNHCYSCHGLDGKGNGPASAGLPTKPKDLTLLSKNNAGHFPYVEIRRMIDGRMEAGSSRAHMKGNMPIWGDVFLNSKTSSPTAAINGEAVVKMRILNLVDYLVSIQEKQQ